MAHWTYEDTVEGGADLEQGDILRRTPALIGILDVAHRHFADEKYTGFIVLTQTCDLVRRGKKPCDSRYVNVAAVRPLCDLLPTILDAHAQVGAVCLQERPVSGVYPLTRKGKARDLVARILNQNEQALGLFYLHPDADAGVAVPSVAVLQLSIALRREHYAALMQARTGRLKPEFQSRLGWLAGNLYSRVAVTDWGNDTDHLVTEALGAGPGGPSWVGDDAVDRASRAGLDVTGMSPTKAAAEIAKHEPQAAKVLVADRVVEIVRAAECGAGEEQLALIRNRLLNDAVFTAAMKAASRG